MKFDRIFIYGISFKKPHDKSRAWGALHKRGASERFAALSYATVCFKKAPRSAPRHSLELSFGERFFATYRCIEIKANKNGVLIFQSSVLCQNSSEYRRIIKNKCVRSHLYIFGPEPFRPITISAITISAQ